MIILGLHFGHDAAVTVIKAGQIASYVLKERLTRVKHAATLSREIVELALDDAGVTIADIDLCAVSSTQAIEPVFDDPSYLDLKLGPLDGQNFNSRFLEVLQESGSDIEKYQNSSLLSTVYGSRSGNEFQYDVWTRLFPEYKRLNQGEIKSFDWFDRYFSMEHWDKGLNLDQVGRIRYDQGVRGTRLQHSFHYPAVLTLQGREIPACYIHHHLAHAAASYYLSGFENAAILTHDGFANGHSYHSGMLYYAEGGDIYPLGPHHLALGGLYDYVGVHLGLGSTGPSGKLMGLAAYGKPRFFESKFVGNQKSYLDSNINLIPAWISHCEERARYLGYDFGHYKDPAYATVAINADIAASTQKLFEETRLKAVHALSQLMQGNDLKSDNLCLTGGTALNCPSNSQIYNEGPFKNVYIEPSCDDSGIAIGAALALYHSILGNAYEPVEQATSPFMGLQRLGDEVENALNSATGIEFEPCPTPGESAAIDVDQNKVVAWYQGRSESGPRALGGRSIIAHPGMAENWERVNKIKKRETWRPFAPAVLESEAEKWFAGVPCPSPYMLFNAQVRSQQIPAVTHVDNTARIQTVNESNGEYYRLIDRFFELTGIPVVMNTSLNGPGEPIIEQPEEAIDFLKSMEIDVLYIDNFRVTRSE